MRNDDTQLAKIIGERIYYYRKLHDLTQKELGHILNVSDTAISSYEKGTSLPTVLTLKHLADYMGIPLDELIEDNKAWLGRLYHSFQLNDREINLLKAYRKASARDKKLIAAVLSEYTERLQPEANLLAEEEAVYASGGKK